MTPQEYRARAAELLRQLAATDAGQAMAATVRWGYVQVEAERSGGG